MSNTSNTGNTKVLPHSREDWEGYTIDEVRYMRAYTAARMEIARERLQANARNVVSGNGSGGGVGLMSRILGTLSYLDIALVTFKLGKSIFRIFRTVRGK